MPKKGTKWTAAQVSLLRAWIDQGLPWDSKINFKKPEPSNLYPHAVTLPDGPQAHPLDRILGVVVERDNPRPDAPLTIRYTQRVTNRITFFET